MVFSEIIHRRRDARGWTFRAASPGEPVELDDWCVIGEPDDPKVRVRLFMRVCVRVCTCVCFSYLNCIL